MVYVDEIRVYSRRPPFNNGSCHMISESLDEIHAMAEKIGLKRAWFQGKDVTVPHYDLTPSKRAMALAAGAREATREDFGRIIRYFRSNTK